MIKNVACGITIVFALVASVWGAQQYLVTKDKFDELTVIVAKQGTRLDNKIKTDQIMAVQQQIWAIENQWFGKEMPPNERVRLQQLRKLLIDLQTNR